MGRVIAVASVLLFVPSFAFAAQAPAQGSLKEAAPAAVESPTRDVTPESATLVVPVQVFVAQLTGTQSTSGWSGHRKTGTHPDKAVAPSPADAGFGTER